MTASIALELPWPPSVNGYWVHRGRGTFISDKGVAYRKEALAVIRAARIFKPMEGRVQISLRLYPPDNRHRDIDNLFKCLFDSLQHGGLVSNDSQFKKLNVDMCDLPDDPRLGVVELYAQQIVSCETHTISNNSSQ